jgi:isoquinoline 1-oxidoreductase alpha subunit
MSMGYAIRVNGKRRSVDVDGATPLLWVLRDELDLKGSKFGCGMGMCGACSVLIDGKVTRSCITPLASVGSRPVTTIEGVGDTALGRALQRAWLDVDVVQCGYCQAGQIMAATALLGSNPSPSDGDIDAAMTNLCRCGTYLRIRAAIGRAADSMRRSVHPGKSGAST